MKVRIIYKNVGFDIDIWITSLTNDILERKIGSILRKLIHIDETKLCEKCEQYLLEKYKNTNYYTLLLENM